jgi:hypothetical protein
MNPHNPDFEFPISQRVRLKDECSNAQLAFRAIVVTLILRALYLWWLP